MNTILNIILRYLKDIHTLLTELLVLSRSFKQFTEYFVSDTTDFRILRRQPDHKPVLRDNAHVCDRLGVSMRTVRRFIARGELKIYETVHKRNYYRDEDVEALRQRYRGY